MDVQNLLIDGDAKLLDAMNQLETCAKKVLFIAPGGVLRAAVTDGDIRRRLLAGGTLKEAVRCAANYHPHYLTEDVADHAREYMLQKHIEALPIVDNSMVIVDVKYLYDSPAKPMLPVRLPVVIMMGGKGTRLYPFTKILPKPLIPVGDIPISVHIIHSFLKCGCLDYYFILNHKKNMIKAYFNEIERDYCVTYLEEDQPLGTGGGVRLLQGKLNQTFILTNCDILIDADFSDIYLHHQRENNAVTMICSLKNYTVPYGVVEIGDEGQIETMKEKPRLSFFTNTGLYLVEPVVLDLIAENEAIDFPDVILRCQARGLKTGVYPISEGAWLDMGQLDEMKKMAEKLEK